MSCTARLPVSDTEALGLKGPVKAMSEDFFLAENSFDKVVEGKLLYRRSYLFDQQGKFTEILREDMLIRPKTTLASDDSTILMACDSSSIHVVDTLRNSMVDSLSITTSSIVPKVDNEDMKYGVGEEPYALEKFLYTNDSICIVNIFDRDNRLIAYEERNYSAGRLVKSQRYTATKDVLISKTTFSYNDRGQLTNKTTYYERNNYEVAFRYAWWKKYESYNYNFINYESRFNMNGQISQKKKFNGRRLLKSTKYTYKPEGDIASEREIDELDGVDRETKYTYRYDHHGNWTECVERRFDGNVFLRNRQIDYY